MSITKQEEDIRHELTAAVYVVTQLERAIRNNVPMDELYHAADVWLKIYAQLRPLTPERDTPQPPKELSAKCTRSYPCPSKIHVVAAPRGGDAGHVRAVCVGCANLLMLAPPCRHGFQDRRKCDQCSDLSHPIPLLDFDLIVKEGCRYLIASGLERYEIGDVVTLVPPSSYENGNVRIRVNHWNRGGVGFAEGYGAIGFNIISITVDGYTRLT